VDLSENGQDEAGCERMTDKREPDRSALYYQWPPKRITCGGCGVELFFGALLHIKCVASNQFGEIDEEMANRIHILNLDGFMHEIKNNEYRTSLN